MGALIDDGPPLVDLLTSKALASNPVLRSSLLRHCCVTSVLPESAWPRVLQGASIDHEGQEAALQICREFSHHDGPVTQWARASCSNKQLPIAFRLRLHESLHAVLGDPCIFLREEGGTALLAGKSLPPEVLPLLDAADLWPKLVAAGACVAAASLLAHAPHGTCLDSPAVTMLVEKGFKSERSADARACCSILETLRSPASSELLSLLSAKQPFHLFEVVRVPSDDQLHHVIALLALRHADKRVPAKVFPMLKPQCSLMTEVLQVIAAGERWTQPWWPEAACDALRGAPFVALESILSFDRWVEAETLQAALDGWYKTWDGSIAENGDLGEELACSKAAVLLRSLRHLRPDFSRFVAEKVLVHVRSTQQTSKCHQMLLLEILACGIDDTTVHSLSADDVQIAARQVATRQMLVDIAKTCPQLTAPALARDAATALWALRAIPECNVVSSEEHDMNRGFVLRLKDEPCGFVSWISAREACSADPTLASSYPGSNDPEYLAGPARQFLVSLGLAASTHASPKELVDFMHSVDASSVLTFSMLEKLAWLEAARKRIEDAIDAVALKEEAHRIAMLWAMEPKVDRLIVMSAVTTLIVAGGTSSDFVKLWPCLKRAKGAAAVGAPLLDDGVPEGFLSAVLASSTLSTKLVARQLARMKKSHLDVELVCNLALYASPKDRDHLADDHPAVLLTSQVSELSISQRNMLLHRFLSLHRELSPEGSPHGDVHGQHLRLWLCLGRLTTSDTVATIAALAETVLRGGKPLPATRIVIQNVWANAALACGKVMQHLSELLQDASIQENFAYNCVAIAAQVLLHPHRGRPSAADGIVTEQVSGLDSPIAKGTAQFDLLAALVGWSSCYVHGTRLLASLALYHALDRELIATPGWYLLSLQKQLRDGPAFAKFRGLVRLDDWVSSCWGETKPKKSIDLIISSATKRVSSDFLWAALAQEDASGGDMVDEQKRPERDDRSLHDAACNRDVDVVICASLVDNLPNMAGLCRTAEAMLGSRVEVALRNDKVLTDPSFQKMVVAADRKLRIVSVPEGQRLLAYLREHRSEGRQIVALEQTAGSVLLKGDVTLPRRCVFLVGNEQQGLPAWLLQSGLVDICVELPLAGCTGSLNVHVAAAMLLWHYKLQH
eukprot:TRINITY_DN54836_c0_g1_i1.p1 TRINITY_DN54836_c0_g1~~TRINITY_DN54836_c0_g1_i1.p1  ORF type:complete len:1132 (+),score=140.09 TRINITY_DN54836_c0_g1_i1:39-3434(+)